VTAALQTLKLFVKNIIEIYGPEYLQPSNHEEILAIPARTKIEAFRGVLGALMACIELGRIARRGSARLHPYLQVCCNC
jgi:hypothetical protein